MAKSAGKRNSVLISQFGFDIIKVDIAALRKYAAV